MLSKPGVIRVHARIAEPGGRVVSRKTFGRWFAVATLLLTPVVHAQDDVDCFHRDKAREGSFMHSSYCGLVNDSEIVYLTPEFLQSTYFDPDGLSCVSFSPEAYFWIREDGRSARVPQWDTSCPAFEEGLSVAIVDGRQVYIDKELNTALDPGFESISYFRQGLAEVCEGPFVYEQVGEHTRRSGGQCGLIDRSGELVVGLVPYDDPRRVLEDYRNAHNECPPPPIESAESALCHAKRHARNNNRQDDWPEHSVKLNSAVWFVSYAGQSGEEFTIYIGATRANLINIIKGDIRETFERNLQFDPGAE